MEAQACKVTKNLTSLQVFSRNPYEPFQRSFFIENIRTTATRQDIVTAYTSTLFSFYVKE